MSTCWPPVSPKARMALFLEQVHTPHPCVLDPPTLSHTHAHAHTCSPGHRTTHAGVHMHAPGLEPWPRSVLTRLLPQPACCVLNSHFNLREAGSELLRTTQLTNGEAGSLPGWPPHPEPARLLRSLGPLADTPPPCPPTCQHNIKVNLEVNKFAKRNRTFKRGKLEMPKGGCLILSHFTIEL